MTAVKYTSMNHMMKFNVSDQLRTYNNASLNGSTPTMKHPSTMDATNTTQSFTEDILTVYDVNAQEVKALLPLIFFYSIILIIGVIGNALVLMVYSFRYKRSPARVYILFLAAIDFSICLFGLPYHLIDMTHPYTYTNALACKGLTFIIVLLFHMSIFGLIVIAVDRYLKICKPLGKVQVAYFGKKRACGAAVLASLLLSWPNLVLYGLSEMESPIENITGYACFYETQYYETNYLFIYIMTTLCICLGSTVFLIIAYSLICHQICKRYKGNGHHRGSHDDTEYTEEVSLKYIANENTKSTILTNCTTSRESMNPLQRNSTQGSSAGSLPGHILNRDSHLIEYTPNGSLTFIGYSNNNSDSNLKRETTPDRIEEIEETSELLKKSKPELNSTNKIRSVHHIGFKRTRSCENIATMKTMKFNGLSKERPNSANPIFHTNCDETCVKLLHGHHVHASVSDDMLKRNGDFVTLNQHHDKSKRFSLQVPHTYQAMKKDLTCRRTSDIPEVAMAANRQRHYTRRWKSNCSVIMTGGHVTNGHSAIEDGLRIHHSSHQSIASFQQGPIKAQKTVTRQHSKITKIMLTITIIFVLSYAPALVVHIWSIVVPEFWDLLTETETIVCEFFLRLYLINNICNPFIYGFWDKRFKREIIYVFNKLKTSLRSKLWCKKCTICKQVK